MSRWARKIGSAPGGRAVVIVALVLYLGSVVLGGRSQWDRLQVPAAKQSFLDLRAITSAWDCERRGVDPLHANPCDPLQRTFQYPRLWLLPGRLGLDEGATVPLGVVVAIVFVLSALWFLGPLKIWEGFVAAAVLCSPAVMLGVERGNADLVVFAVLVLALALFRSRGKLRRALSHLLFLLAAMLKLYPAFAFSVLARQRRPWLFAAAAVVILFVADLLLTLEDLRAIRRALPQSQQFYFTYGAGTLADAIVNSFDAHTGWPGNHGKTVARVFWIVLVVAGFALAAVLGWLWRKRASRPLAGRAGRELDGLWVGASIYVGTYVVMRNFDYRLVFLFLALPQLLRWAADARVGMPGARWVLAAVVAALWLVGGVGNRFPFEECLNWIVFVYLAAALAATAPRLSFEKTILGYRRRAAAPPV